jgi:transcriptional regulator with XRE-family HTH domain
MTNAQPSPRLDWTLGDRLYKSLRVSGLSNTDLADELGVSRNTIGNYIADRTEPKDGQVKLWALRTGIPYEELRYGIVRGGSGDGGPAEGRTTDYGSEGSAIVSDFRTRTAA